MTTTQMFIIVLFSGFAGWIISHLTIYLLLVSATKKEEGIIPAFRPRLAIKASQVFQYEFESSKLIDEKIADPTLLEKMKPEIEKHVDFFLNEKLATVFPLLYKFMGEKTLLQFKEAFMIEIDLLFPVIIKNYMLTLKKDIYIGRIIEERINAIPVATIRRGFYENARKEILRFKFLCLVVGLLMGLLTVAVLHFVHM